MCSYDFCFEVDAKMTVFVVWLDFITLSKLIIVFKMTFALFLATASRAT